MAFLTTIPGKYNKLEYLYEISNLLTISFFKELRFFSFTCTGKWWLRIWLCGHIQAAGFWSSFTSESQNSGTY